MSFDTVNGTLTPNVLSQQAQFKKTAPTGDLGRLKGYKKSAVAGSLSYSEAARAFKVDITDHEVIREGNTMTVNATLRSSGGILVVVNVDGEAYAEARRLTPATQHQAILNVPASAENVEVIIQGSRADVLEV